MRNTRLIFDKIENEKFFVPLTSNNSRLYYATALKLMECSLQEPTILYKTALNKAEACIKLHCNEASEKTPSEVLSYLKEYGWITPKRLTADNHYVITVTKDCSRILSSLREYSESGESEMMNHLYTIRDILGDIYNKENSGRRYAPYQSIYRELVQHHMDLAREMGELFNNIDNIIKSIMKATTNAEYFDILLNTDFQTKFFSSYSRMKNGGNSPLPLLRGKLMQSPFSRAAITG